MRTDVAVCCIAFCLSFAGAVSPSTKRVIAQWPISLSLPPSRCVLCTCYRYNPLYQDRRRASTNSSTNRIVVVTDPSRWPKPKLDAIDGLQNRGWTPMMRTTESSLVIFECRQNSRAEYQGRSLERPSARKRLINVAAKNQVLDLEHYNWNGVHWKPAPSIE